MAAQHQVNPDQLKMFMTPKEITEHYQPLDNDREDAPRAGSWTGRPNTTGGRPNKVVSREGIYQGQTHRAHNMESDEQLWDRKSYEAQMDPEEYHYNRAGTYPRASDLNIDSLVGHTSYPTPPSTESTSAYDEYEYREASYLNKKAEQKEEAHEAKFGGPSIWDSVRQSGVKNPVHLGSQFGSRGKPQIVGGHHRIASAMDTRPNELIPVLHHEHITEAQDPSGPAWQAGFKYT